MQGGDWEQCTCKAGTGGSAHAGRGQRCRTVRGEWDPCTIMIEPHIDFLRLTVFTVRVASVLVPLLFTGLTFIPAMTVSRSDYYAWYGFYPR
jgi:hypothetical protein